jgi:hypothetical protein
LEVPETDVRILTVKEEAIKFEKGDLELEFSAVRNADGSAFDCGCLEHLIREQVEVMIRAEYDKLWLGDKESLVHLPVESLLPILLLKNFSSLSTSFDLSPEVFEYGFDPDVAFMRKIPPKKQAMLKEIDSQFIELNEGDDQQAVQIVIDENFVNKYLLEFVLMD